MSAKYKRPGGDRRRHTSDTKQLVRWVVFFGVAAVGLAALNFTLGRRPPAPHPINAHGLRVSGEGRADATRVLPAAFFADPRARRAYAIAHEIPAMLNVLYCWCGCIERGMRSNLQCFESEHATGCDICMAGAEIAWEMKQRGVTDPAVIQRVLDARFGHTS